MRDMNGSPVPKIGAEKFAYELYEQDFRRRLGFEFTASGAMSSRKRLDARPGASTPPVSP